jgi:argininosuccinate lyase
MVPSSSFSFERGFNHLEHERIRIFGIQRRVFHRGSSLMPQKKNPEMAELTRGKTGRLFGNLMSILTTMKALPFSYNRDVQEDKEALFDSVDTIKSAPEIFALMLPELKINRERMKSAASDPHLLATDLAEHLVKKSAFSRGSRTCWQARCALRHEGNGTKSGSTRRTENALAVV